MAYDPANPDANGFNPFERWGKKKSPPKNPVDRYRLFLGEIDARSSCQRDTMRRLGKAANEHVQKIRDEVDQLRRGQARRDTVPAGGGGLDTDACGSGGGPGDGSPAQDSQLASDDSNRVEGQGQGATQGETESPDPRLEAAADLLERTVVHDHRVPDWCGPWSGEARWLDPERSRKHIAFKFVAAYVLVAFPLYEWRHPEMTEWDLLMHFFDAMLWR